MPRLDQTVCNGSSGNKDARLSSPKSMQTSLLETRQSFETVKACVKRWLKKTMVFWIGLSQVISASDSIEAPNRVKGDSANPGQANVDRGGSGTTRLALTSPIVRKSAQQDTEPKIYKVERLNDLILVHFDTETGRAYVLQFCNSLLSTNWSELYAVRALPFPNHYIVADALTTNAQRFYRLAISPYSNALSR